jgi:hypothetical protein
MLSAKPQINSELLFSKDTSTRRRENIRSPVSVTLHLKTNWRMPNNFFNVRSFWRMNGDIKLLKNVEI